MVAAAATAAAGWHGTARGACVCALNSPNAGAPHPHFLQTVLSWDPDTTRSEDYEFIATMAVAPSLSIQDML